MKRSVKPVAAVAEPLAAVGFGVLRISLSAMT